MIGFLVCLRFWVFRVQVFKGWGSFKARGFERFYRCLELGVFSGCRVCVFLGFRVLGV